MQGKLIEDIRIREILDSRGGITVEAIASSREHDASAMIPNSTSTGSHEVFAFPKGGVSLGISNFNALKKRFIGMDPSDQDGIDYLLHEIGGEKFSVIGGNIAAGVSIAAAKLAAKHAQQELYEYIHASFMKKSGIKKSIPRPIGNLIGGGAHSRNKMAIQEILVSPKGVSFAKAIRLNAQVHKALGDYISGELGITTGVNIEGAWVTGLADVENLETAKEISGTVAEEFGAEICIGADFAASEYFSDGAYRYCDRRLSPGENVDFVISLAKDFNMEFIEDPMNDSDFSGFSEITKRVGRKRFVVGDDLYVTNKKRLEKGIRRGATNSILIKVNQVGTLSDTIDVIKLAHKSGINTVVSHRSRETTDSFIAHLAVAFGSKFIKTGIVGGERVSKLNELQRIEEIESK